MRFKLLGNSGLRVSEMALGAMTFGTEWGFGSDKDECRRIWDTYVEAGGNFIDTANHYTAGTSETWVGEFAREDRHRYVISTKYTLATPAGDPNASGNHRKSVVRAVEASLRRLGTDFIDLYWVHAWDYITPAEEILRALDDLVRAGKVLYVGVSDAPAWAIARSNAIAELRGWSAFCGMQLQYSLIERGIEREHLPLARATDMAVTVWGAIGGGVLSGKYLDGPVAGRYASRVDHPRIKDESNRAIARAAVDAAKEIGCTPTQLALAWVRRRDPRIVPIVGVRNAEQTAEAIDALDVMIPDDVDARLCEASAIGSGFPYDFLETNEVRGIVYGGVLDRLDVHRPVGWSRD
ncbi:MAG: aldo/keto reductase [Deltaproteobacteria bacterium]|nr:aldo/keto reductase [Deltaproteobacteria bacterium]